MTSSVLTAGVDLAAQDRNTATAVVRWTPGNAVVGSIAINCADDDIVQLAKVVRLVGIDSPLGWPERFIDFVAAQRDGSAAEFTGDKKSLVLRRTDHFVNQEFGLRPLSVSADLIGHVAIRAVRILDLLRDTGVRVDRSGLTGRVAETYPAGAIRRWLPDDRRYKGKDNLAVRAAMLRRVEAVVPMSFADPADRVRCEQSDHAFDALLCALVARAVVLKQTARPPKSDRELARREGWIAVPVCDLDVLTGR